MVRRHNTEQSAHDVIRNIVDNHPVVLHIQRELVDDSLPDFDAHSGFVVQLFKFPHSLLALSNSYTVATSTWQGQLPRPSGHGGALEPNLFWLDSILKCTLDLFGSVCGRAVVFYVDVL
jgi:hypothetical protein